MEVPGVIHHGDPNLVSAMVAASLGWAGFVLWWKRRRLLAGTTLVAPCNWALLSLMAMAACEVLLGLTHTPSAAAASQSWRFGAGATTFCPVMAILGAKRPQDKAWQLIVLSLWVVLVLPAAETLVYGRGAALDVRDARVVFLWCLVAVGLFNALPTRFWPAALLYAGGQVCLFADQLPLARQSLGTLGALLGMGLPALALALVAFGVPRRRDRHLPEDRVWLDFRDMFGAVWGLRVAGRINAYSSTYGWQVTLTWQGFRTAGEHTTAPAISGENRAALRRSLHTLLRRFVSPEWVASRLEHPISAHADPPR